MEISFVSVALSTTKLRQTVPQTNKSEKPSIRHIAPTKHKINEIQIQPSFQPTTFYFLLLENEYWIV